jgi:hypothetical protein
MGHADFRFRNEIFATLGWLDATFGVIKLTPEEQAILVQAMTRSLEHGAMLRRRRLAGKGERGRRLLGGSRRRS